MLGADVAAYVKRTRSQELSFENKLTIVLLRSRVVELGLALNGEDPNQTVARLLCRSKKTVRTVWKEFQQNSFVSVASRPDAPPFQPLQKPQKRRHTFLPRTPAFLADVQQFVRERRSVRMRTVAKDVLQFAIEMGYVEIDETDQAECQAALRATQRLLRRFGYGRGKRKRAQGFYRLASHNELKRDDYVFKMAVDPPTALRRKVYLDESYIHHHYSRHNDSVYDPTDPNYVHESHKGRRFCFIAAIIDADRTVRPSERTECQQVHLIKESLDIFVGGKGKKETKDYHGMFDHAYFVRWMEKLLLILEREGFKDCVIVLDNAKYHSKQGDDVPKKSDNKAKLQAACQARRIAFVPKDTKTCCG